jgi:PhoPQ-activated pathogenicity-related protein
MSQKESTKKLIKSYCESNPGASKAAAASFIAAATHNRVEDVLQWTMDVFGPSDELEHNLQVVKDFYESR